MDIDLNRLIASRKQREYQPQSGLRLTQETGAAASTAIPTEALLLLARLQRRFGTQRDLLLDRRAKSPQQPANEAVRKGQWSVATPPEGFQSAPLYQELPPIELESTASAEFIAPWIDLRDRVSPTWERIQMAHLSIKCHADSHFVPYNTVLRPRTWVRDEPSVLVDGDAACAAFFDIALFLYQHAQKLTELGGVTLALGDLTCAKEAVWWNDALSFMETELGLPAHSIRAAVEVDSVAALAELDPILFALRSRASFVVADRFRYLASAIQHWNDLGLSAAPERRDIGSNRHALRAYSRLLVQTAHNRGALAVAAPVEDRLGDQSNEAAALDAEFATDLRDGYDSLRARSPLGLQRARRIRKLKQQEHRVELVRNSNLNEVPRGRLTSVGVEREMQSLLRLTAAWLHGLGELQLGQKLEHIGSMNLYAAQLAAWCAQGATTQEGAIISTTSVEQSLGCLLARLRGHLGPDAFIKSQFERASFLLLRFLRDGGQTSLESLLEQALPGNALRMEKVLSA